jgi:hypothetical protein
MLLRPDRLTVDRARTRPNRQSRKATGRAGIGPSSWIWLCGLDVGITDTIADASRVAALGTSIAEGVLEVPRRQATECAVPHSVTT